MGNRSFFCKRFLLLQHLRNTEIVYTNYSLLNLPDFDSVLSEVHPCFALNLMGLLLVFYRSTNFKVLNKGIIRCVFLCSIKRALFFWSLGNPSLMQRTSSMGALKYFSKKSENLGTTTDLAAWRWIPRCFVAHSKMILTQTNSRT